MWRSSLRSARGSLHFQHIIQDTKPNIFLRKNSLYAFKSSKYIDEENMDEGIGRGASVRAFGMSFMTPNLIYFDKRSSCRIKQLQHREKTVTQLISNI